MGRILILKDVAEIAKNWNLENVVLFGEKDFIDDTNHVYDFIFFAKQTLPYRSSKMVSLVIPVIKASSKDEAINIIYSLFMEHPDFNRFAVLQQGQDCLDFYNVCPKELGKEINLMGKYFTVDNKQFYDHVGDEGFEMAVKEKIKQINTMYLDTEQHRSN